jgi:hypothetical protein
VGRRCQAHRWAVRSCHRVICHPDRHHRRRVCRVFIHAWMLMLSIAMALRARSGRGLAAMGDTSGLKHQRAMRATLIHAHLTDERRKGPKADRRWLWWLGGHNSGAVEIQLRGSGYTMSGNPDLAHFLHEHGGHDVVGLYRPASDRSKISICHFSLGLGFLRWIGKCQGLNHENGWIEVQIWWTFVLGFQFTANYQGFLRFSWSSFSSFASRA